MTRVSALLSVDDIPPEILQEIFLFAISDRTRVTTLRTPIPYSCYPTYRSSSSPYSISHVCRRWRDISTKLPELWTYLCIVNPKSPQLLFLVKEWINRSRSLPLHLALHEFKTCTTRRYPDTTKAVLSVFLDSLHRCKTFVLDLETPLDDDLIDAQIQPPVLLDRVSLSIKPHSQAYTALLATLLCAPNLLSVSILAPICLRDAFTSWGNLQHLAIQYSSHHGDFQFPQILSHCPRLKRLDVQSWFDGNPRMQMISLPQLERLTLKWVNHVGTFLSSLRVPALSELVLNCHMPLHDHCIVDMLEKSKSMLKVLEINAVARDAGLVKMLEGSCLTELEVLALTDLPVPGLSGLEPTWPQVINLLMTRKSGTWQYLPHLQYFSLCTQNIQDVVLGSLEALAQTRLGVTDLMTIGKHRNLRVSSGSISLSLAIPK